MKKNWLGLSLILNLVLMAVIFICGVLLTIDKDVSLNKINTNQAPEVVADTMQFPEGTEFYQPKPIELEWMSLEEKNSFGINTSTESRIQILSRDPSGKIENYRIIRDDKDILKEY